MDYTKIFEAVDCKYKDDIIEYLEYEFEGETLADLAEFLEDGFYDYISEIAYPNVEVYDYDLRVWAVDNSDAIDNYVKEFGIDMVGGFDFHRLIQLAQYWKIDSEVESCVEAMIEHLKSEV